MYIENLINIFCCYRYLDPKSLLAGARSHKLWLDVCRGDPVLRQKLQEAQKEEKNYLHNIFVNPKMLTNVSRKSTSGEYGTNIKKTVTKNDHLLSVLFEKIPNLCATEKRNFGKKTNKMYSRKRFSPYRV